MTYPKFNKTLIIAQFYVTFLEFFPYPCKIYHNAVKRQRSFDQVHKVLNLYFLQNKYLFSNQTLRYNIIGLQHVASWSWKGSTWGGGAYIQVLTLTFLVHGQEQNPHSASSPLPLPIKWGILQIKRVYTNQESLCEMSNPKMLRKNEHSLNKVCIIKSFASVKALSASQQHAFHWCPLSVQILCS